MVEFAALGLPALVDLRVVLALLAAEEAGVTPGHALLTPPVTQGLSRGTSDVNCDVLTAQVK